MKYIVVLIGGLLLFFLSQGIRMLARKISSDKRYFRDLWTALNIAEFVFWIIYVFWSFDQMLSGKSYYQYIVIAELVVLIFLLGYYFINDLVAGAIFKIQHHPQRGKYYDFKKYSGKILRVGSTGLLLETSDGQELDVPYSEIKGPVFERKEMKAQSNIIIQVKGSKDDPKNETIEKIRMAVLTSAYTSLKEDPVIKVSEEGDDYFMFDVLISTLNNKHQSIIEREIRAAIQS